MFTELHKERAGYSTPRMVERLDEDRAIAPNGADLKQVRARAAAKVPVSRQPPHSDIHAKPLARRLTCLGCGATRLLTAWLLWCRRQLPPGSA